MRYAPLLKGLIIMQLAITILQLIVCLAIIIMVVLQSGKTQGLGAIAGAADNFLSKSKAKSLDAKLTRATKWVALVFAVLTIVLNCI
jgi:preprotein translocase subunit SecG